MADQGLAGDGFHDRDFLYGLNLGRIDFDRNVQETARSAGLVFIAVAITQEKPDEDAVWKAFIGWFRSAPPDPHPFKTFAARLQQEGVPELEIKRRVATVLRLFPEHPEGIEI